MIIVEDSKPQLPPQDHAAAQLSGDLGPVHPQSSSGTPAYAHSYHTTTPLLPPSPPPSYPKYPSYHRPAPPVPGVVRYHQSPAKRFWQAFAIALVIYVAFVSLTHTIVRMASRGNHWDDGPVGAPRAEDGRVLESIGVLDWSLYRIHPVWAPNYAEGAETSFTLPIASEQLYLISRGSYQNGKVQVRQSTERGNDDDDDDFVRVDVRVAYHSRWALGRATVVRLQKGEGRNGIGIHTPTSVRTAPRDQLHFEVVFTFPAARSERAPLRIKEFTTLTSNFAHEIGDLWQSILFDNVELRASNARIQADSITLTRGSLSSSNAPIIGHFNTSDTLILHTSNAHIQATASLFSAGRNTTKLDMQTSNGAITSSVSLITESDSGGSFVVNARSSNGAIRLQYDDAPSRAHLVSDVRTSNSLASAVMHPAFEGRYEVSTSNNRPVVRDLHRADPLGADRRRIVNRTVVSQSTISGTAYWEDNEGARRGAESASTVRTSNGRASLDL